jgi:hypothetical protein
VLPVTSCTGIVDSSAAIYIMVVKFRITICPSSTVAVTS